MAISQFQIKTVLDEAFSNLPIDNRLLNKVLKYEKDFINKNEDHITFFGGHLTGVQIVRFDPRDRSYWFDDVLQLNEDDLQESLYALTRIDDHKKEVPLINPDFNVISDTMNIVCTYLIHRMLTSDRLSTDKKKLGAKAVVSIMLYKFLTSLLWAYFKYPANPAVAEATYNALSRKFGLKRAGSWKAYLTHRAELTTSSDGTHYNTLMNFADDDAVLYFISDTQGRIRRTCVAIYAVFDQLNSKGIKIISSSNTMEISGEEILKDKTRTFQNEIRYITQVVGDKGSFIKDELLRIVEKSVPSVSPAMLKDTLGWMSDNIGYGKDDIVNEILTQTVLYSFNYLASNPKFIRNKHDVSGILYRLRGSFTSSRSTDEHLMKLRELGESIAGFATSTRNDTVKKTVRTAILLYIVARVVTKNYYSQ